MQSGDAFLSGSQMGPLVSSGIDPHQVMEMVYPVGTGISGSVNVSIVGGNVSLSSSTPPSTVNQGTPNTLANAWAVKLTDGVQVVGTGSAPLWVTGSVYVLNPSGGGAGGNVTAVSGSVTGLLVGGQALSLSNPLPVTGSVSVTAAVAVSNFPSSFQVSNFPATQTITGSVGLTAPITGNVGVTGPVAVSNFPGSFNIGNFPSTQTITGSVGLTAPITGTVAIASSVAVNNFPSSFSVSNFPATQTITGSVGLTAPITGNVGITAPVSVGNFPAGFVNTDAIVSGSVTGLLYGGVVAGQTNPFWVTGSIFVINQSAGGAASNVTSVSGSVTGLLVGGVNVAGSNPVPVTGSVGLTAPITGSVVLAVAPQVNQGTNPWTITGSVGLTAPITGTVAIASSVAVNNFPATQTITGTVVLATVPLVLNASTTASSVIWNNSTPQDTTFVVQTSGYATVGIMMRPSGTITNGAGVFEFSDDSGVTWVTASMGQQNLAATNTFINFSSLTVGGTYWQDEVTPATNFRVRLNPAITGSGQVTVHLAVSASPHLGSVIVEQAVASQLQATVTGSVGLTGGITGSVGLSGPITGSVGITSAVAVSNFPATQTVTGSVGLTGGITGSVGLTGPITGSVVLASAPTVVQGTNPWVTSLASTVINSGSVTGLLYGGVAASAGNPIWITGSVGLTNGSGGAGGNVTAQSGSVAGLLVGGVAVSFANQVPVTGSVGLTGPVAVSNFPASQTITGSVGLTAGITGSVVLASAPTVVQGTNPWVTSLASTVINSGSVTGLLYGGVAASAANPIFVTGSVGITAAVTGSVVLASAPQIASGSVTGLLYGGVAASAANPIFVTGSVGLTAAVTGSVVLASAPQIASGSVTGLLVGGQPASLVNALPVSGTQSGIATLSGASPGLGEIQVFLDPGNIAQAGHVNNMGSQYIASPGVMGTRRIVGSYRAVVGPLSGTVGPMANIVNPNTGTLTVYLKQATVISSLAIDPSAAGTVYPPMIYMGSSNATLTGTTVASVALSQSYPANSTAVITSVGSNNVVTNKIAATFLPTIFGASGTVTTVGGNYFTPPYSVPLFDRPLKEADDLAISPGHAYTIANTGGIVGNFCFLVEISWDEGGPV